MPISTPRTRTYFKKTDLLISGHFRYYKMKTTIFTPHLTIASETQTYFWSSLRSLRKTEHTYAFRRLIEPRRHHLKQNLCNMFSSKSFVKTVALQLFRTSNLFGFLYVTAHLFRARFHCYFVCSLFSQPIPMRLPSIPGSEIAPSWSPMRLKI